VCFIDCRIKFQRDSATRSGIGTLLEYNIDNSIEH